MQRLKRAALIDVARGQGEEALNYWKQMYKAIPLISPIEGEVIVAKIQPGQTVNTSDAVFVLERKENVLLLPQEAVFKEGKETYILTKDSRSKEISKRQVKLGMSDEKM